MQEEGRPPQCLELALTLTDDNCCVLRRGHAGEHQNCRGYKFWRSVKFARELHDAIVELCGCNEHPRYQAKRKPKTDCDGCWRIWVLTHPNRELSTRWMR